MTETGKKALALYKKFNGTLATTIKVPLETEEDFSIAYMPGVAEVAMACTVDQANASLYTIKGHSVAVVTDGSSVLGLGNIGPLGALPVMESKAMLYKKLVDIDAFPICLATQDADEMVKTIKNIAPAFGAIHLEDIAAPRCFEVENTLQEQGILAAHNDQHGTALVIRAALVNAAKVVGKPFSSLKVVISGGGAAAQATAKLLLCDGVTKDCEGVADVIVVDSKGIIEPARRDLDTYKQYIAEHTNKEKKTGDIDNALTGADVFIGVSRGNIIADTILKEMAQKAIVFALSNPDPEVHPDKAKDAGAAVIATGRADFPNQVNNALGYPGLFKGAIEAKAKKITQNMVIAASDALAAAVENPTADNIIPTIFTPGIFDKIAQAVKEAV